MERKRCQVCDGPVVNGRCKLCGMPYRNDETLYHLNENRSDHYRHATSKARAIMRQEEIPLGDKKVGNAVSGSKTGSKAKSAAGESAYNKGNVKSGSYAGQSAKTQKTSSGYKQLTSNGGVYTQKKAKKKKSWLIWLILLGFIGTSLPEIRDSLEYDILPAIQQGIEDSAASSAAYEMKIGEVLEVSTDGSGTIQPGHYVASCEDGYVSFMIVGDNGESGSITVTAGDERKVTLKDGDFIGVIDAQSEDCVLQLITR